jgi:hypothetical protein
MELKRIAACAAVALLALPWLAGHGSWRASRGVSQSLTPVVGVALEHGARQTPAAHDFGQCTCGAVPRPDDAPVDAMPCAPRAMPLPLGVLPWLLSLTPDPCPGN